VWNVWAWIQYKMVFWWRKYGEISWPRLKPSM
jgi:hypothetical protein